jgi:hypothetical protein
MKASKHNRLDRLGGVQFPDQLGKISAHAANRLHEENAVVEKDPDLAVLHGKPRDG